MCSTARFEISNVLRLTIVYQFFSLSSQNFLYTLKCFLKNSTLHSLFEYRLLTTLPYCTIILYIGCRVFWIMFRKKFNTIVLIFQCAIVRHNRNCCSIGSTTNGITQMRNTRYRKHYGRKWGHLKITVHPIIITTK